MYQAVRNLALFTLISISLVACTMKSTSDVKSSSTVKPSATEAAPTPSRSDNAQVLLHTSMGDVTVELFSQDAPITAGNFEKLVSEGFYNGIIFHRVIPDFMAQTGDPTGTGTGGPGYKIKDEFAPELGNVRGTLSMANSGPNTGGSQFFINVVENSYLDGRHAVFGKVIVGMEVVDAITEVDRDSGDKPLTDVIIIEATLLN